MIKMAVKEAIKKIEATAKQNIQEMRVIKNIKPGQVVRQGDIYIMAVAEYPHGQKTENRQLVDGQTSGSRHIVESGPSVFAPNCDAAPTDLFAKTAEKLNVKREALINALYGPSIKASNAFVISHPEHAHICLPAGNFVTWSQLDPRTMQRVQD